MKVILGKLNSELLVNLAAQAGTFCTHVDAAVAYADGADHPFLKACLEHEVNLTFYGLLDESGAVGVNFLQEILARGPARGQARLVKGNFHPKVIWWRGFGAYVGSANLSQKAWFNNVEAGVFLDEDELTSTGAGADLDKMFAHLEENSVPVTDEILTKLRRLQGQRQLLVDAQEAKIKAAFDGLFGHIPNNPGQFSVLAKGVKENKAEKLFVKEWTETLQTMRGLSKDFAILGLRPTWVDPDVDAVIHFDQFLHAYYYRFVRRGLGDEDDTALSGLAKVKASYGRNRGNPAAALESAAIWWADLQHAPGGEDDFIRVSAPSMRAAFSRTALGSMNLAEFIQALQHVHAFQNHARQVSNAFFGLPHDHHENRHLRAERLCTWLWQQQTATGKSVRDVLEFVLWGSYPTEMEQRLWLATSDVNYNLPHFGQSSLGEAVGWARPDKYPPRNNRTNKALIALGHSVRLFSSE